MTTTISLPELAEWAGDELADATAEEVLGWVLVPVILLGCYWLLDVGLNAMGTSPAAIMEGIEAVIASL